MISRLLFYFPWILLVTLGNILISLNFSKIPIAKTLFTSFLNGANLSILTLIFLVFVVAVFNFSLISKLLNRKTFFYFLIYLAAILIISSLFSKTAGVSVIKKAENLKNISIIQEIIRQKSPSLELWQVGDALIVAFVSESFGIPVTQAYGILRVIFSVSASLLLLFILSRFARSLDSSSSTSSESSLGMTGGSIFILVFLYLLFKYADLKTVLLSGLLLFAINLLLDYFPLISSKNKKMIYFEEIQFALLLIYFASLNSLSFKIGIVFPLVFTAYTRKLRPLIILLLILLINPLIVGLALRF